MSPRDWFWFLAGALVAVAVMVTLRAWPRDRPALAARPTIPAFAVPIAAGLALIGVALGIYFLLGSPDTIASAHGTPSATRVADSQMGGPSTNAGSLDDVTRKLANRLATKGGSDSDWNLLAESYEYMGRTADAKAARAHIASATASGPGTNEPVGQQVTSDQMAGIADALDNTSAATPKSPKPD